MHLEILARSTKSKIQNLKSKIGRPHLEEAAPSFSREDLLASRLRVAKVVPFQGSRPPFISNLSLAICSGLLLVFAFPDWNLWSLGWVGAAPLIMAVAREQRFWRSLLLGWVSGTVFYVGSSHWVTYSMHNYGSIPLWLSYVILTVLAACLAAFTGLFAGALGLGVKRFGGWAILAAPLLWAASEWARIAVVGVGWNGLGYSQAFNPSVIQIARLGGVYIVSALMASTSTALVFAVIYLEKRRGVIVLTAAGVLAIASVLYGQSLRPAGQEAASVTVVVIQPNIPIEGPWDDPIFIGQMLARHIELSEQAIAESGGGLSKVTQGADSRPTVDLVVWPESPMILEYERNAQLRRKLAEFTHRNNIYLLMNGWGFPENSITSDVVYNSAMVIAPSGERIFRYDKIALVPFGEYVPARGWIPFMDRIPALVADVTPGTSFSVGDIAGAKIGTAICFEATRPEIARRFRAEGASVLAQLSNESWFGPTSAARQMLAHAVFRAVENNLDLIRATNSGLSARIDRYGAVQDETQSFQTATRVWKVKSVEEARSDHKTFYTRYGDVFAVGCAALSLIFIAAASVPEGWRKKERDDD
jgi:apolipoprotein N-acyltransferase